MKFQRNLILLLSLFFELILFGAKYDDINFKRITKTDGLGHNHVECIFQDSWGFIWFGTRNGLCRFDGYEIKTFRSSSDSNSLSGNWILSINENNKGELWIGTCQNGANRYERESGKFYRYGNSFGIGSRINRVTITSDGVAWLSTSSGLAKYIEQSDTFLIYKPNSTSDGFINAIQVFDMCQTKNGKCYVAPWSKNIQLFDPVTEIFTDISYQRDPTLTVDYRKRIIEDDDGNLWVSANQHGVCRIDPETGKSKLFVAGENGLNTNILNGDLMEDSYGNIWISSDGGGIDIYDKATSQFNYLTYNDKDPNGIPGNHVYTIYLDKNNITWVGFYDKGVAYFDPHISKFSKSLYSRDDLMQFRNKSVICLFQDSKGNIWIGTDGDGLYIFDKSGKLKDYKYSPTNNNTPSSNVIKSLGEDQYGNILIGTYAAGFNIFNPQTKKFTHISQMQSNPKAVNSSSIWEIFKDSRDNIWLGLLGTGLDLYDPTKGTFENFGPASGKIDRIDHPNLMVIQEDSDGDIWFGTEGNGVYILDHQSGKIVRIQTSNGENVLEHCNVKSFYVDRFGNIWIGTEGEGAYKYHKKSGDIKIYGMGSGISDLIVQGILEDVDGNIWMTTGNGISMLNTNTQKFTVFYTSDGLSANDFNADAFLQLDDGRMLAGSTNGLDLLDPREVILNQNIPKVVITQLEILNKEISAGDTLNGRVIIEKQITYTDKLTLTYKDKIFSLQFAALNYSLPEKCNYKYMLEGFDKDWVATEANRRFATYSNLSPGLYTFKVKASNNDGKWGNNITELTIEVLPPFWATIWFISIAISLVLFVVFIIYRSRLNYYRTKHEQQQADQEKRIVELEKENLETELQKLTFYMVNRNRVLIEQKNRLLGLSLKARESVKKGLEKVMEEIDMEIRDDKDWSVIEPQIDKSYNNFITKLRDAHADITLSELKIAAYVRMNLSTKEISELMHKTFRGVENDRYRLRKKLNLDSNDSLQNYLMNL